MEEIYTKLLEKGSLYDIDIDLERVFTDIFRGFYNNCPYEEYSNFSIPEDYLWFMEKTGGAGVAFYSIDQYIYGTNQMIYYTIDDLGCNGKKNDSPVFWLYAGHRNERGFFFICCDKRSEYYGQVCEFYDGSPFMDHEDGCELGDFKTFCNSVLNGGA